MNRLRKRMNPEAWFWLLLATLALGGSAALFWMTRHGIGLVNDSAAYLAGAQNLLAGNGYALSYRLGEYTPITHFPPLLSLGLAAVSLGLNTVGLSVELLDVARGLNGLLFAANILLAGFYLRRVSGSRMMALLGAGLLAASEALLRAHAFLLSEPLFLLVCLLWLLALESYRRQASRNGLAAMALLSGAGLWARYAGVALVLAGILILLIGTPSRSWRERLKDTMIYLAFALPGALALGLRNLWLSGSTANRSLAWHLPPADKLLEGCHNLWAMILPRALTLGESSVLWPVVLCLGLFGSAVLTTLQALRRPQSSRALPALTLGWAYLLLVGVSITFFDHSIVFDSRILLPGLVCLLLALLVGLSAINFRSTRVRLAAAGIGLLLTLANGIETVRLLGQDGQGFAAAYWRNSQVMEAAKTLPPGVLYSTRPMGVLLHTGKATGPLLDAYDPVTGAARPDYLEHFTQTRQAVRDNEAALVIFEYPSMLLNPAERAWARQIGAGLPILVMYKDGAILGRLGDPNDYLPDFEEVVR